MSTYTPANLSQLLSRFGSLPLNTPSHQSTAAHQLVCTYLLPHLDFDGASLQNGDVVKYSFKNVICNRKRKSKLNLVIIVEGGRSSFTLEVKLKV
jgi:hypothetical protein